MDPSSASQPQRLRRRRMGWTIRITPTGVFLLGVTNLVILAGLAYAIAWLLNSNGFHGLSLSASPTPSVTFAAPTNPLPTLTLTIRPSASATTRPPDTTTPEPATPSPQPIGTLTLSQGLLILALDEGGNTHLFAYQPQEAGAGQPMPLTRLTYGPWDDINPAISPDGHTVAFASNRNGYWDIYLLALANGSVTRLTDTLEYEAAPAWSPDGKWLAYEAYVNKNLEIKIQALNNPADTVLLTNHPAADFSPAWSPDGRRIVFVSNRSGDDEIWLADLDKGEGQRFEDLSQNPGGKDIHPTWSPDGTTLVWVSEKDGLRHLFIKELASPEGSGSTQPDLKQQILGNGDWPTWSADGETIITILQAPNRTYLTAYRPRYDGLVLPALQLPGNVNGLSWGKVALAEPLAMVYEQAALLSPTPLYTAGLANPPTEEGGRYELSQLAGIAAPQPYLHDAVDESFQALRRRIALETGWDFLSSLENAYVPLTSPLEPGMGNDWLYTGRAIAVNALPVSAGWMAIVREDYGLQTYWRVYLRALYQDGSAGIPLHDQPWDFNSRINGNTSVYEQGGAPQDSIPAGYWIDFTARARYYGWERLPALTTWRASYKAARFNEYVSMGELDWQTAMLELYPPEALITPTPVIPPTRTFTPTSRWYVSPTPTLTPSPRPTLTPPALTPTYQPGSSLYMPPTNPASGG